MKNLLFAFFCGLTITASSQDAQNEIDEQVWKIFIESFNSFDTEKFMSVHSKDVVRSPRDANTIMNWTEYHDQMQRGDNRSKAGGEKRNIELRFIQRILKNDLAMDIGIYKTTADYKGKVQSYYGKFLVTLRKENNLWKILVDTDSSEGGTIDEKQFSLAAPMKK